MTKSISAKAMAAILLSAAIVLPATAVNATRAAAADEGVGTCSNGWQELYLPDDRLKDIPMGAITRDGALKWIVGGGHTGPLALKWNGTRLVTRKMSTDLRRGVAAGVARNAGDFLVGGYKRPKWGAEISPLLGRIVGKSFKTDPVDVNRRTNAAVADLIDQPGGRGWAVGTFMAGGRWKALALRRKGGRWLRADPPSSGRGSGLLGVTRTPGGTVWAAGWRERDGVERPFIVKRTGSTWKTFSGAALPAGPAVLTDIAFPYSSKGWTIGYVRKGNGAEHRPFLQRWNGRLWERISVPWAATSAIPQSLSVGADGDLWIAGTQLANAKRETRGFVAHRRDGEWTMRFIDTPADVRSSLQSVDATDDGAVVTGTIASTAIVLRSCEVAGPAAKGRKISIAGVRKRAKARDRHDVDQDMPTIASTGAAAHLAAPVPAVDFVIRDVADESGIAETTRTYKAISADFDNDGWKDIFISRHQDPPKLALGGPDGFTVLPNTAFSATDRHACDAADVDKDGWKDILCVAGRRYGTSVNRHELSLEPAGDEPRSDREVLGIADPLGRGRNVAFIRLDDDAYPEVLVVDQPEREDVFPATNRFYRNEGGQFVSAPEVGLDRPVGGSCAEGTDVDGDGDQDLLLCVRFPYDGRDPGLRVYRNDNGVLRERSKKMGLLPIGDIDVKLADVDGDGRRDLIQLAGNRLRVSRRTSGGFKKVYQLKIDKAIAVAAGDVNGDGRADIYIVRGGGHTNRNDRLLLNDGNGRSYTSTKIPQAGNDNGRGDDVVALDYDKNGLTDFLVVNGRGLDAGPIQLLASFPVGP